MSRYCAHRANGRFRRLSPPIGIHSIARYIRLSASLQGVEPCVLDLFPQELSLTDAVERVLATKPEGHRNIVHYGPSRHYL